RDDARAARQVPERLGAHRGHPLTVATLPSRAASRAGSPDRSSHAGASAPMTTAAVLAALAATQVGPATLTVFHGVTAGRPVRGSTMWWSSPPSVVQRRTCVPELASPPDETA